MKVLNTKFGEVDISPDLEIVYLSLAAVDFINNPQVRERFNREIMPAMQDRSQELIERDIEAITAYLADNNIPHNNLRTLIAHGRTSRKIWSYYDQDRGVHYPVQSWVDKNDSKADTLVAIVCNSRKILPIVKHSTIIYPIKQIGVGIVKEELKKGKYTIIRP